jgi:hypothetical protein
MSAAATDEPLLWTDGIFRYANSVMQVRDLDKHVGPRGNTADPAAVASVAATLKTFTVSGTPSSPLRQPVCELGSVPHASRADWFFSRRAPLGLDNFRNWAGYEAPPFVH